jgi:hypothetical protein
VLSENQIYHFNLCKLFNPDRMIHPYVFLNSDYGLGCAFREIGTKTATHWPSGARNPPIHVAGTCSWADDRSTLATQRGSAKKHVLLARENIDGVDREVEKA